MKIVVKWKYPNEVESNIHENTYYDINPSSIAIAGGFLRFATTADDNDDMLFSLDHIVSFNVKGDD